MTTWQVVTGDVRERLADLPAQSVQTCVTSPPYWGLRDYGHPGQIGLERTPEAFTEALVAVFRDVRRVLKDDGTVWLNLGDSYAGGGRGGNPDDSPFRKQATNAGSLVAPSPVPRGLKQKDLVGVPWRVAFALQADGWYLRSDIIWSKPNPMPESVTDRPTKAHEYIFLLSKQERYYYDAEAIAETAIWAGEQLGICRGVKRRATAMGVEPTGNERPGMDADIKATRNKRTVWSVSTWPYPGAHFATYPEDLIEPCILAGSRVDDTVLDPFTGSGTTGVVCVRHQRNFVGVELNPSYVELARKRIGSIAPLLASEVA